MRAWLAGILLVMPTMAQAGCGGAFVPPPHPAPGDSVTLLQSGMAAMVGDRMDEAEFLLLSSFAHISELTGTGRDGLELNVMARLAEVAVQRNDMTIAMFRAKVVMEKGGHVPHAAWVDDVVRYVEGATVSLQDQYAGSEEYNGCRAFGVQARSAVRIQFATDSAALDDGARAQLSRVAANLAQTSAKKVVVRGHTDLRGTDAYNDALSLRRASAVVGMLTTLDRSLSGRLVAQGMGKREPLFPGEDEDTLRLNRRVDFTFADK